MIKKIALIIFVLASLAYPTLVANSAVTCFYTGEQTSGMNKICYYNCMGSTAAITVSSVSLCPLTIQR